MEKIAGVMEETNQKERKGNPFGAVWTTVKSMLEADGGLEAKTILEFLMEEHPGEFNMGQLRTLQRVVRAWRLESGPEKEVYFGQVKEPGRQSQSDFTNCDRLGVTIKGEPFPHLLFHFMLPYSRWESCEIAYSESFENLVRGFARAVKELGGCAHQHRTDNLAAAVKISEGGEAQFNDRWVQFLDHYHVEPSRSNEYKSNENGSVEKSHDLLKKAIKQRMKLRKSRDFASQEQYERFIQEIVKRLNNGRQKRLDEEKGFLKPLPAHEWSEAREVQPQVTAFSTITVCGAVYSVPSRLIGVRLKALIFANAIRVYYGSKLVQEMERQAPGSRRINYRHVIGSLVRKPGAFERYQYRDELFPSLTYRWAFDELKRSRGAVADREYLRILYLAAMSGEQEVATALEILREEERQISIEAVKELVNTQCQVPGVKEHTPVLARYDRLLFNPEALTRKDDSNEGTDHQSE